MNRRTRTFAAALTLSVAPLTVLDDPARAEACADLDFRSGSVETEAGIELFVRQGGGGEATVVVPADFLLFDELCPLAADFRVVFYDMRNRGRSSRVTEGEHLTLEADVADLEAVRRHLGIEEIALVGYSYLGKMVVEYAIEHPGRVSRIVQLGPVPMDPDRTLPPNLVEPSIFDAPEAQATISELRALRAEGLHESDPQRYCELEWGLSRRGLVGDPAAADEIPSRCDLPNEWPSRLAFHMQHHFVGSMLSSVTTATEAASLDVPVLVIHGTRDRNAPYGGGREWAASLRDARLLSLPGLAHAAFVETDLLSDLRTFLAGDWPAAAALLSPSADPQLSQLRAWDLVRSAFRAHAPQGLSETGELLGRWRGVLHPRSQSRTSEPPFEPAFDVVSEVLVDPDGRRLERIEELRWPEFTSRYRTVVTDGDSFEVDLVTGAVQPTYRQPREEIASAVRSIPPLLLRALLASSAGSLRFEGVGDLDGETVTMVSAHHLGERIDLYFAADGTLFALGRLTDEPMLSDVYELTRYRGRQELAGLVVPESVEKRLEGLSQSHVAVALEELSWVSHDPESYARPESQTRAETEPETGEGGTPSSSSATGSSGAAGAPGSGERADGSMRELAPRVYLATLAGAADYYSLVVERDDHLVVVEAPVGREAMTELMGELATRFPGKPVRYVVATHHHFDHSSGVPAVAETGATLITTPGNVRFFRRAVTGPRTLSGLGESPATTVEIVEVSDVREVPGGEPAIRVVRAEPSPHVEEILFVHLPAERLLFQGDLVRFPIESGRSAAAGALARKIDSLGLEVERIAGVHGDIGTMSELREARNNTPEP
ncbi:MAG TPA: alpha/beta fold hydrolase [Thermoanaerobaculia bacterium]|nr:alpha/beta fold hydrolase [Thermoanaerobaculia bacterium]